MSDTEEKQLLEEQAAEAIKEEKKAAPKVYFDCREIQKTPVRKSNKNEKLYLEERPKTKKQAASR